MDSNKCPVFHEHAAADKHQRNRTTSCSLDRSFFKQYLKENKVAQQIHATSNVQ